MKEELKSIKYNQVWDLAQDQSNGNIERYKVKIVATGYTRKIRH